MTDAIIGLALAVGGILAALLFGRRQGRKAERANQIERQAKADAKATQRAEEARNEVDRMSDDAVREWMRNRARK